MSVRLFPVVVLLWATLFVSTCGKFTDNEATDAAKSTQTALRKLPLDNLDAFQSPGKNWSTAGGVYSDSSVRHSLIAEEGKGTLVSIRTDEHREDVFTKFEHGDLELKCDFLIPRRSNSGIFFQSRYEVQVKDSWGIQNPEPTDIGGIYPRWDEEQPEGFRRFDGHAPKVNAGRAPGEWNTFHFLFRAPRFDNDGNKIENARFDWIYLNGILIHENVELSGPTAGATFPDEQPYGPLRLQGSHGPVAFRNMYYATP